jgi:hypothetical protein
MLLPGYVLIVRPNKQSAELHFCRMNRVVIINSNITADLNVFIPNITMILFKVSLSPTLYSCNIKLCR